MAASRGTGSSTRPARSTTTRVTRRSSRACSPNCCRHRPVGRPSADDPHRKPLPRRCAASHRRRLSCPRRLNQWTVWRRTNIAPQLKAGDRVIYLRDLDLSGGQIEGNTQDVLEREISGALAWERLALTKTQVREYDLPVIVKHDRRYKDGRPHEAVETEAISQRVLIDILQARLDALLPEPLTHVQ